MSPVDVARRYLDAWNAHDPAAVAATFAPDGTYTDPLVAEGVDPAGMQAVAQNVFAGFPDLTFDIGTLLEKDGTVAAEWVLRGTHTGEFAGIPPTGRSVSLPGVDILEIEEGRIRAIRGYFDPKRLLDQLAGE